jgi:hypothetical protein
MSYPTDHDRGRPRRPAVEPEIILPGEPDPRLRRRDEAKARTAFYNAGNGQRVFVVQPSPWTMIAVLLSIGAIIGVALLLLIGFVMLWLPVIGVVAAGIILLRLFGGPRRGGPPVRR